MKTSNRNKIFIYLLVFALCLCACAKPASGTVSPALSSGDADGLLTVAFIDVGQGDSTLIITPSQKTILIDAGEQSEQDAVLQTLEAFGIKKLDVIIGTHPHSDHIGGLASVVRKYEVESVFLPNAAHTSSIYTDLLSLLDEKDIAVYEAIGGTTVSLDASLTFELLGPLRTDYTNLNDVSIITKLTYKDISVLITGDAEKPAGADLVNTYGAKLNATVLRLPHHGSNTAATAQLLPYVTPQYAVISCGLGNSYGHPHTETLLAMQKNQITTFRTDELGTILMTTDGEAVTFDKPGEIPTAAAQNLEYVYVTNTGKTYHRESCSMLAKSKNKITFSEALAKEYTACKKCFQN